MRVYILLDRSGSMVTLWNEAINSINHYVSKLNKKDHVHFVVFDGEGYDVLRDSVVGKWTEVSPDEVTPRGTTPLYDACGKIMAKAESYKSKKTLLVVMTDGYENCSSEFNRQTIQTKMDSWKDKNWEIVFLGANFQSVESVSSSLGVGANKTLNYSVGNFTKGMDILIKSTVAYGSSSGLCGINFTDDDKKSVS